ncbi:hypothetical protein PBOI14_42720 [Pseudomonas sp. Boi14]|nr:hypothetical protein PBOI14_42720 [Pseudomonas sp. Boi14]
MSVVFSMAAFALAASITPGPVNIVALGSGARFGFRASLRHVAGAPWGLSCCWCWSAWGCTNCCASGRP